MSTDIAAATEVHLLNWFDKNRARLVQIAGLLAVGALVIGYYFWHKQQSEVAASEAVSKIASGPYAAEAYLKIATEHPSAPAAQRAVVLAAGEYFAADKFPEAQTQFERVIRDFAEGPFRIQATLGVAACLDAQGKADEAATRYNDIIQRYPTDPAATQARSALARVYEAQGKFTDALAIYQELARTEAYTSFGLEAGVRLQALLAAHPELVPKPLAPAPALTPTQP